MNKPLKLILIAVLLVGLVAGAAALYNILGDQVDTNQLSTEPSGTEATENTKHYRPAPDFTVLDMDGNERKLSGFIGEPIIVNFWASWCGPCQMEMPDFEAAYKQYGTEIHFLMVNCTTSSRETMDKAKALIADEGYTFPVYFDTTGYASSVYGAYSIPLTFFIDAEGNVRGYAQGAIDAETLQLGIDRIYTP